MLALIRLVPQRVVQCEPKSRAAVLDFTWISPRKPGKQSIVLERHTARATSLIHNGAVTHGIPESASPPARPPLRTSRTAPATPTSRRCAA